MTFFTENPWPLTIMFLIVAAFLAWNAMRSGVKKVWQAAGVMVVLGLIPLITSHLIETDREKITGSLNELAKAVVDSNVDRALSFLDGDSDLPGSIRPFIESNLQRFDIHEGLRIKSVDIKVTGDTATSDFRANGTVSIKNVAGDQHAATRWMLNWKRVGADWKITTVALLDTLSGEVRKTFDIGG